MKILELIKNSVVFLDGAIGTYLQQNGLEIGQLPESLNLTKAQTVIDMHKGFLNSGSNVILTNTFGANCFKFNNEVSLIIEKAVKNAKQAVAETVGEGRALVALDIGPTGKLLEPMGDLSFENAYECFKQMAVEGEKNGVDLVMIETMSDLYELKSAVLAVKENTNLPVFATVTFDEKGKLLTGADVNVVVATLEGLGVDALGVNCGLGPKQILPLVQNILEVSSLPVIVKPNAGLPHQVDGKTVFDVDDEQFANAMKEIVLSGASIVGGCCGTMASHIAKMVEVCKDLQPKPIEKKHNTIVTSYSKTVQFGKSPIIIGERINPTGKPRLKAALRENNLDYILKEAIEQQDKGAHILDVNMGLPEIDETQMMYSAVQNLQSVVSLPLQIDSSNVDTLESGMRIYNGKPMVNSVNGKAEVMHEVFPLIKKYGGVVVALTLDEEGIPNTAQGRFDIAKKIIDTAKTYGIDKKDIVIDPLAMTISSDPNSANVTLTALEMITTKLGVNTILGVSNISFGLPQRQNINSTFFALAMQKGLSSAIINPSSEIMMNTYYAFKAVCGLDENFGEYIGKFSVEQEKQVQPQKSEMSLSQCIQKGLKEQAHEVAMKLIDEREPLDIINSEVIPALDIVGKGFEKGSVFLPQLLMSASAAKAAFEVIKTKIKVSDESSKNKQTIILATVQGDIHDIGKNIVKVLLENYSFNVIDLGKDVAIDKVVSAAIENNVKLIGLSALMTTTVENMQKTIEQLKIKVPDCVVMVGGAVLTQEYADMIGADAYCKDAMETVKFSQRYFGD